MSENNGNYMMIEPIDCNILYIFLSMYIKKIWSFNTLFSTPENWVASYYI